MSLNYLPILGKLARAFTAADLVLNETNELVIFAYHQDIDVVTLPNALDAAKLPSVHVFRPHIADTKFLGLSRGCCEKRTQEEVTQPMGTPGIQQRRDYAGVAQLIAINSE